MKGNNIMKKTCLLGVLLLCSTAAISQELFPELSVLNSTPPQKSIQRPAEDVGVPLQETYYPDGIDVIQEEVGALPGDLNQQVGMSRTAKKIAQEPLAKDEDKKDEDEDDGEDRRLRMFLDEVDSTLTPVRTMSFCFATIKLYNQLKKPLKSFQATLTYGDIPIKFTASNVAPNGTASQSLTLAGTACEYMLDTPQIDISKCNVDEWEEKKCKERFLFEPYESTL